MWKIFNTLENLYAFNIKKCEESFKVQLSNFISIWSGEFTFSDLTTIFHENNTKITATTEQIIEDIEKIIENVENSKISIENITEINLDLKFINQLIKSKINAPLEYKFKLIKGTEQEYKDCIAIRAIKTIYLLEKQQEILLNVIRKKDRELEEYKLEKGGEISRNELKTDKFDSNILKTDYDKTLFLNVFSNTNFTETWKKFESKNGEVQSTLISKSPSINAEPWNVKKKRKVVYNSKKITRKGSGIDFTK